MINITF